MSQERVLYQEWERLIPDFQKRLWGKELIVFDFDGTLTPKDNPEFDEAMQMALAVAGGEHLGKGEEDIMALEEEIRQRYLARESITNFFQEILGLPRELAKKAMNSVEKWRYLKKDPNLVTMLTKFGDFRLGLASNSPRQENVLALEQLGLSPDFFELMIFMEDVSQSKPHPELFEKVLELSGLPVEACVFVGDSLTKDIRGAQGVGMDGILVGEASDEAVAWVPEIYDLSRLFERFQVFFVEGESNLGYPHLRDTQQGKIIGFSENELLFDAQEAREMARLLNSGVFPDGVRLE